MKLPLANGKYRKRALLPATILGYSALAVWIFHFYLWCQYDATRPARPDAVAGRSYPLNSHGHVVYLTKAEDGNLSRLTIVAFGLFALAFVVSSLWVE